MVQRETTMQIKTMIEMAKTFREIRNYFKKWYFEDVVSKGDARWCFIVSKAALMTSRN